MTITRETLELAALAGGIGIDHETFGEYQQQHHGCVVADGRHWAPHTDIGDAARLAVRAGIIVQPQKEHSVCHAWPTGPICYEARQRIAHDGTQADAERAYCDAVTLCAAEIGRKMKESQA